MEVFWLKKSEWVITKEDGGEVNTKVKPILLKFKFVAPLSLKISSMLRIIIKVLEKTGGCFIWFV